jgi:hypothetical protein
MVDAQFYCEAQHYFKPTINYCAATIFYYAQHYCVRAQHLFDHLQSLSYHLQSLSPARPFATCKAFVWRDLAIQ